MSEETRIERPIRIRTAGGAIEGCILVGPRQRTLDYLGLGGKRFVTLHSPRVVSEGWKLGGGPVSISKSSILFVQELDTPPPRGGSRFGSFSRSSVHLRVAGFDIEGFVHVPPGGEAMRRLDQDNHLFVSITSAVVTDGAAEFVAAFLAVNRAEIMVAQQTGRPTAHGADSAPWTEAVGS